jgi:hypothetical protein
MEQFVTRHGKQRFPTSAAITALGMYRRLFGSWPEAGFASSKPIHISESLQIETRVVATRLVFSQAFNN